jgi:hypothetical protein
LHRKKDTDKGREKKKITIVMGWGKSTGSGRIILNFACFVQFYGGG